MRVKFCKIGCETRSHVFCQLHAVKLMKHWSSHPPSWYIAWLSSIAFCISIGEVALVLGCRLVGYVIPICTKITYRYNGVSCSHCFLLSAYMDHANKLRFKPSEQMGTTVSARKHAHLGSCFSGIGVYLVSASLVNTCQIIHGTGYWS